MLLIITRLGCSASKLSQSIRVVLNVAGSSIVVGIFALIVFGFSASAIAQQKLTYKVLGSQPHNSEIFTQGFYIHNDHLYESSGLYNKSFIQVINLKSNSVVKTVPLPATIFAEGLTVFDSRLYLLTWQAGTLLSFDLDSLKLKEQFNYQGQGWGLTHDDKHFIMSNGSATLTFRDKKKFNIVKSIEVRNRWRKFINLNELEYAEGFIFANVWQSSYILKISPEDGTVAGIADLSSLASQHNTFNNQSVLNGIAYDAQKKLFGLLENYGIPAIF